MNLKPFIKLGNKSFNIGMISYMNMDDDELTVTLEISYEVKKFKFQNEESYNRFKSYVKLFSTEFNTDVELIEQTSDSKKPLLKD
jgi:hypothetical protein